MPSLSIITICFNAADCIERTLRSVSKQTDLSFEYLIIDGASKDCTLDMVRQICPFARIYSEPDNGIYDAMNKGLIKATGDYVWFMNAGDEIYDKDTVAKLHRIIASSPDVIYGDTMIKDDDGKELGLRRLRPPKVLSWKSFSNGMLVCHQSFIARRSLTAKYDLRYRFSADFDWCIKVLKKSRHIVNSNLILSGYLKEGATTNNHKASLKERFRIMCHYYGLFVTLFKHFLFLFIRKR